MGRNKQQGVVLWVSLVVLVVMMAATVAILRNTSGGQNIAGNLGFKQNSVTVSDLGVEAAGSWLLLNLGPILDAHSPGQGYFATFNGDLPSPQVFDPFTHDWAAKSVQTTADDGTGNRVNYVIHRLCVSTGNVVGQECSFADIDEDGKRDQSRGSLPSGNTPVHPYFRVTVRVIGPRGTVTYIQTVVRDLS